jgi:peptidoglycan/LPS O-acetylase OafA/YrhL
VKAKLSSAASEAPPTQAMPGASATTESVRSEVGYIPAIEGLRGIAVLWVVAFHYVVVRSGQFTDPLIAWIDAWSAPRTIVRSGFLGVDLFFIITGFLLTLPWFKHDLEGRKRPSTREFYIRRARRILPAYYVQLAMLFFVFLPLLNPTLWRAARGFVLGNLGLHVLFLHYTTPYSSASLSINGPLWTLALEMQYYLLLPLIAVWFLRAPYVAAGAFLAAALIWKTLALHDLQPLISLYGMIGARWNLSDANLRHFAGTQLPGYLGHFALGILCGRAWLAHRATASGRIGAALLGLLAACSVLALYAVLAGHASWLGEHAWVLIPLTMVAAIWAAVSRRPAWGNKLLGFPPLAFIGRISYSMYLYHLPVLLLFNTYAPVALGGFAFPCYFGVIIVISTLSFRFVELPFMRQRSRGRSSVSEQVAPRAPTSDASR